MYLIVTNVAWVWRSVAYVSVCLSMCPRSKRKTARAIKIKVCTIPSACIDPEVKRSKAVARVRVRVVADRGLHFDTTVQCLAIVVIRQFGQAYPQK